MESEYEFTYLEKKEPIISYDEWVGNILYVNNISYTTLQSDQTFILSLKLKVMHKISKVCIYTKNKTQ